MTEDTKTKMQDERYKSFQLILPFLRDIEELILDDSISEIMINSSTEVFRPDAHRNRAREFQGLP